MRLPTECYQMCQEIEQRFANLRPVQQSGLAYWVYGSILAQSSCQSVVATALEDLGKWDSIRHYLREWLYDGLDKADPSKTQLGVSPCCFEPLLNWVLS